MRKPTVMLVLCYACLAAAQTREVPPDTTSGFVAVSGGRIFFEVAGEGEALVLIHGGLLDLRMWDPIATRLAASYRVIRYDVRGHGQTESEAVPYSHVADLTAVLDELEVEDVSLVGLSMGSGAATQFAISHPERVRALVLVSPGFNDGSPPSAELTAGEDELEAAFFSSPEDFVEAFARLWLDGPRRQASEVPAEIRASVKTMALVARSQFHLGRQPKPLEPAGNDRLREIRAPALIVVGDRDMPDVLLAAPKVAGLIPGAKTVTLRDVAHLLPLERPANFSRLLEEFLSNSLQN